MNQLLNKLPYILIIILLTIVFLQTKSCVGPTPPPTVKIDTVYKYIEVKVPGKTVYIKGRVDTVWMKDPEYRPDSNCHKLLEQYMKLGDNYFKTNIFQTRYNIDKYGYVTVTDTISKNKLQQSSLTSHINIPVVTKTIDRPAPPKRQLYGGFAITGNAILPINGAYIGILYKDKKEKIFGASIGYNGQLQGMLSYHIRLE